jgi:uncharacterized protein
MASIATFTAGRHHLLDALRGFALLGIVIANYPVMAYYIFMPPEEQALLPYSNFDPLLKDLEAIFIQGKFYSIFSLLFGIGFGIFMARSGTSRFLRRMVLLSLIGLVHLRFFWEGDILLLYALLGFTLPLFNKLRDRWLISAAIVLLLIPIPMEYMVERGIYKLPEQLWRSYGNAVQATGIDDTAYFAGGPDEFLTFRSVSWRGRVAHVVGDHRIPKVLALFLIGLWVARRGIFQDVEGHRQLLRNTLIIGGIIGLSATLLVVLKPSPDYVRSTMLLTIGTVPLALSIASAFALAWQCERGRRVLHVLSPAGRMALTNYLGQTLLGQLLFSGVGAALGPRIGLAAIVSLGIAVFVLQVIASHWWLVRYQFGPFEWLWRMFTYGRYFPMVGRPEVTTSTSQARAMKETAEP